MIDIIKIIYSYSHMLYIALTQSTFVAIFAILIFYVASKYIYSSTNNWYYSDQKETMNNPPTIIRVSGDATLANHAYTNSCIYCGDSITFMMTESQYKSWKINRNYIQDVFPHLDSATRESMISGTHPECWDKIFMEENEEEFTQNFNEIISNWKN
jgi:hypothetical protein